MPKVQKTLIASLVQEFGKMGPLSPIDIIRKESGETVEQFAERLERTRKERKLDHGDIIVMASRHNIENRLFGALDTPEGKEGESPLLIGVDSRNLGDESYISFLEMVTMAMRIATGQRPISDHPSIKKEAIGERAFIFMPLPPARALNYEQIQKIYQKQLAIIRAA